MATDWAPVIQTGIGAIAAIGGGVIGAWLQSRTQERIEQQRLEHRQQVERQQRRDRAAVLLAEVTALLFDSEAHWMAADQIAARSPSIVEAYRADYDALRDRQRIVREQLLAMAIGEPSPEVRRLAQDLDSAVDNSVRTTWWRLVAQQPDKVPVPPYLAELSKDGPQKHRTARLLLDRLVEAL